MSKTRVFYRAIPNPSFSVMESETLDGICAILEEFGKCENGSKENKAYWVEQKNICKIVKVTEITEDVEL